MEGANQNGTAFSDKQLHILDVAERLFAAKGYEGTSVRDIAHEADVNVAMISYYFGSKEKLLNAVFTNRISAGRIMMTHLVADTTMHPLEKINALIDNMVDRMLQHTNFHRVVLRAQLTGEHGDLQKTIQETKQKNLELIRQIIADGQSRGVFVKDIDIYLLMMTVTGTVYQAAAGSSYYNLSAEGGQSGTEDTQTLLKNNLKKHLKKVVKATLTYEGN